MTVFYDRVKELVKRNTFFTLRFFIESLGINYDSYNGLKRYNNLPRADVAVKIAKALNTTVEYLVNGKAAEIAPTISTAKENDSSSSFTTCTVTQNNRPEKPKTFDLTEASRISGVSQNDITDFFLIKKYIKKEPYGYSATALGVEKGSVVNDKNHNALITMEGISKVASAFAY